MKISAIFDPKFSVRRIFSGWVLAEKK